MDICVIIPTYNNQQTLAQTIDDVLKYTSSVIVVNDGSTDATDEILTQYQSQINIVSYSPNKGKGYALNRGFDKAEALGYSYAISLDSDGQHLPEDLQLFIDTITKNPGAMIIGSRSFRQKNMPEKSTFANKFSNFWFAVQTGIVLPDTQTGFRLYPLTKMNGMRSFTSRYEAELELLVRSAWKNIQLIPIPIQVYYPEKSERVTHFRPGIDFFRISLLNTLFVFVAIVYGYPSRFIRILLSKIKKR